MVLVGGLVTAVGAGIIGWRDETPDLRRFAYKVLLAVVLPGYIVMRIGGGMGLREGEPGRPPRIRPGSASATSQPTPARSLLSIALIVGGIGLRLSRDGRGGALLKTSSVIATILLAAYIVAVWAMVRQTDLVALSNKARSPD